MIALALFLIGLMIRDVFLAIALAIIGTWIDRALGIWRSEKSEIPACVRKRYKLFMR